MISFSQACIVSEMKTVLHVVLWHENNNIHARPFRHFQAKGLSKQGNKTQSKLHVW